jgi:hypothetical protein
VIGDCNGRTGRRNNGNIIGSFGEEENDDSGARLIDLCEQNNLKVTTQRFL